MALPPFLVFFFFLGFGGPQQSLHKPHCETLYRLAIEVKKNSRDK